MGRVSRRHQGKGALMDAADESRTRSLFYAESDTSGEDPARSSQRRTKASRASSEVYYESSEEDPRKVTRVGADPSARRV